MKSFALKLYITGTSVHSQRAISNLDRLVAGGKSADCEVTIVDVLTDPDQAEADRVLATPTLIRCRPAPARRVIGDLSDLQAVRLALGLETAMPRGPQGDLSA